LVDLGSGFRALMTETAGELEGVNLLAVRGRLRWAALHLANSRHQRKRRLPAEFKGFGQHNFIKRKKKREIYTGLY
jgi:hypothetical protein